MRYISKEEKVKIRTYMNGHGYNSDVEEGCITFLTEFSKLLKLNVFNLGKFILEEKEYDNVDKLKSHIVELFHKSHPSNKRYGMYYLVYLTALSQIVFNENDVVQQSK
jgi:hypothetical protein